ncbi:MAG: hypothetical protein ACE5EF_11980, partial [Dehalococcoidia bacterium]
MNRPSGPVGAVGFLLVFVALAAACGAQTAESTATPTPTPAAGQALGIPFEIRAGETVALAPPGHSLTLEEVTNDSRCPVDVTCVWAGEVTGAFVGIGETGSPVPMALTLGAADPPAALFDSLRLTLLRVEPQPVTTLEIEQSDYRATVVVEEAEDAEFSSGIFGLVTKGPMCPVAREDQPCPDEPHEAALVVLDEAGAEVARVDSTADGSYAL